MDFPIFSYDFRELNLHKKAIKRPRPFFSGASASMALRTRKVIALQDTTSSASAHLGCNGEVIISDVTNNNGGFMGKS
jgi:hypothetical protein